MNSQGNPTNDIELADGFSKCLLIIENSQSHEPDQSFENAIRKALWFADEDQCVDLILYLFSLKWFYHPALRYINEKIKHLKEAS